MLAHRVKELSLQSTYRPEADLKCCPPRSLDKLLRCLSVFAAGDQIQDLERMSGLWIRQGWLVAEPGDRLSQFSRFSNPRLSSLGLWGSLTTLACVREGTPFKGLRSVLGELIQQASVY